MFIGILIFVMSAYPVVLFVFSTSIENVFLFVILYISGVIVILRYLLYTIPSIGNIKLQTRMVLILFLTIICYAFIDIHNAIIILPLFNVLKILLLFMLTVLLIMLTLLPVLLKKDHKLRKTSLIVE